MTDNQANCGDVFGIDCNYTGAPSQVAAHYSGKQDSDHDGGYAYARVKLEEKGFDVKSKQQRAEIKEDLPDENTVPDNPPEETNKNSGTNPAFETPQVEDAQRQTGNPDCPECGTELHHVNEIDQTRWRLEHANTELVCLNCGGEYRHD